MPSRFREKICTCSFLENVKTKDLPNEKLFYLYAIDIQKISILH